jgi:thymidylate kinase
MLIVEFAGLPRSGKSTSIDAARDYFSRRGIAVRSTGEAALACPFGSIHRVEIACWMANNALNAVLEASVDTDPQTLTLQDRGLFDALAFFHLLEKENLVSKGALSPIEKYFADRRWTEHVDLVVLFDVEPGVALERDIAIHLARELHDQDLPGIITNKSTLQALRACYEEIQLSFGDRFKVRVVYNTPSVTPSDTARRVIEVIEEELKI